MILSQVSHLMGIVIGSIHICPEILLNGTKILNNPDLNGKMPCLKKGDFKMVESGAIVEHLEKTYPEPSLTVEGMI